MFRVFFGTQVSSNLPTLTSPLFTRSPVPFSLSSHVTNQRSLTAAVDAAAAFLNKVGPAGSSHLDIHPARLQKLNIYVFLVCCGAAAQQISQHWLLHNERAAQCEAMLGLVAYMQWLPMMCSMSRPHAWGFVTGGQGGHCGWAPSKALLRD